jgi:hypothetical protein
MIRIAVAVGLIAGILAVPAQAEAGYFCGPSSPTFLAGGGPPSEGGYAMTNKEAMDNAYAGLLKCHWKGWNAAPVRSKMGVWWRPAGLAGVFEATVVGTLANNTTYGCSVNWRSAYGVSGYNVWCTR